MKDHDSRLFMTSTMFVPFLNKMKNIDFIEGWSVAITPHVGTMFPNMEFFFFNKCLPICIFSNLIAPSCLLTKSLYYINWMASQFWKLVSVIYQSLFELKQFYNLLELLSFHLQTYFSMLNLPASGLFSFRTLKKWERPGYIRP